MEIIAVVLFWIVCGVFTAVVANSKGRSGLLWAALGFLFGPLALIAVGFMPATEGASFGGSPRIPCPRCAELIMPGAQTCRYCGHTLGRTSPGYASALPSANSYRTCPQCKRSNPPLAAKCEFCGEPLAGSQRAPAATLSETKQCPQCGEVGLSDHRYCRACGSPI